MFNYLLYRLGEFLALSSPIRISYFIARLISTCQFLISSRDRTSVRNNLKTIFPRIKDGLVEIYTKRVFFNFGKYLVEFFRLKKIDLHYIKHDMVINGLENIDSALALKRGVIIVSAHIGNWELGAAALGILGYPINVVALSHKHKRVDLFFNSQRTSRGVRVIPLGKAVRGCLEAFNRNEIVCLVGDRDFTRGGLVLDFFGRPSLIPRGPAAFSLKSRTPVIGGFTIRQPDDRFCLFFNPPIQYAASGDYEKDLRTLTEIYLKQIEDTIFRYPDQWYMFRKFWL